MKNLTPDSSWDEITAARGKAMKEGEQARSRGDKPALKEVAAKIEKIDAVAHQKAESEGLRIK